MSRPTNVAKRNSIVLSGLSKPWGMPGLRIGWLICENAKHYEKITSFRDYTTLCLRRQSEILSLIALRNANDILQRNRQIARQNYETLRAFLLRCDQWFYPVGQDEHNKTLPGDNFAAVVLFVRLKQPLGGIEAGQPHYLESVPLLVEHLAERYSICLVAGDFFEFHDFPCVRFGIGRANFPDALARLED